MQKISRTMGPAQWATLVILSILWGGSFFFAEIAITALPPFTIVLLRVGLAAIALHLFLFAKGTPAPFGLRLWGAFLVMGLLNNVVPFSLLVWGQTQIASGLASILNATTPIFAIVVAHFLTSDEKMTGGRLAGVLIGFAGVAVMIGPAALAGQEPYPAIWNRSDVAISACGQERLEERSSATVEGRDAATGRKRRVPSGCPSAASRCVIPLARCASIAPRGMPDGLAAGGQQSGSKWPNKAPGANLLAQVACLGAALSYGFAASFGRHFARMGVSPVQTAAGQVTASALVLLPLSMMVDRPWTLPAPGMEVVAAIVALALLSTAVAYILFFRLLASAGATNIALVTLLVPVSAILLGTLILGERLEPEHFAGMALIGLGLAAIDGRPARALGKLVTARSG